jgi:hypothetical protein
MSPRKIPAFFPLPSCFPPSSCLTIPFDFASFGCGLGKHCSMIFFAAFWLDDFNDFCFASSLSYPSLPFDAFRALTLWPSHVPFPSIYPLSPFASPSLSPAPSAVPSPSPSLFPSLFQVHAISPFISPSLAPFPSIASAPSPSLFASASRPISIALSICVAAALPSWS